MNFWMRGLGCVGLAGLLGLSGCGFFPNDTTTSSSTGTTTSGDYVYAVNPTANTISGYTIGSGTLTAISGAPLSLATAADPLTMCVSGTNSFVYVAGGGGIYGFAIGTSGVLTALSSGAILINTAVSRLSCSPDGNWLVGLDSTTQQVDEYKITTSTGLLTAETAVGYSIASSTTLALESIRFSPLAGYVIAALGNAGTAVYTFNTSSGALAYQYTINTGSTTINHNAVVANSTDTTFYIAESGSTSGVLTVPLSTTAPSSIGSPVAAGNAPDSVVLSNTNGFMYVGNLGVTSVGTAGTISMYSFVSGVPVALSTASIAPAVTAYVTALARDNSGSYILVGLGGSTTDLSLYSYSTTTTGVLTLAASVATSSAQDSGGLLIAATH